LIVEMLCSGNDVLVPRVMSIFQKSKLDVWAGRVHQEVLLLFNSEYVVFVEVVITISQVITINTMALFANPTTVLWRTALVHAIDVYFAAHPNRVEHDLEPRVMSISQKSKLDIWAGRVHQKVLLLLNSEYVAFAEVVYSLRSVGPMPPSRGPSSAGSSSMALGPAVSGGGAGSSSWPLCPAPSGADNSSRPPGPAPGGGESDSSPLLAGARPKLMATAKPMPEACPKEGTGLVETAADVLGPRSVVPR
jgi:hypothetical protein